MTTTPATMTEFVLDPTVAPPTETDFCDGCSTAKAAARAVLPNGSELLFCGHHFATSVVGLMAAHARVNLREAMIFGR